MNMTEHAFVIDKQLQRLLLLRDDDSAKVGAEKANDENIILSMQAIVNAIVDPSLSQSKQTLYQVNKSSQYVKWYTLILASYTHMQSEAQVAASSSQYDKVVLNRQGRGFTLKVVPQPTKQIENSFEVTIEQVSQEQLKEGVFLHCLCEQQLYVVFFGVPIKNSAQSVSKVTDEMFTAIANPESHLYLS